MLAAFRQSYPDWAIVRVLCKCTYGQIMVIQNQTDRAQVSVIKYSFLNLTKNLFDRNPQREGYVLNEIHAKLPHPNIVSAFETKVHIDSELTTTSASSACYYIFTRMEHLAGPSFAEFATVKPVGEIRLRRLFRQLFSAVAFLHQNNLVHLAINPENVMLANPIGKKDQVKLIDFSSVRNADEKLNKRLYLRSVSNVSNLFFFCCVVVTINSLF